MDTKIIVDDSPELTSEVPVIETTICCSCGLHHKVYINVTKDKKVYQYFEREQELTDLWRKKYKIKIFKNNKEIT